VASCGIQATCCVVTAEHVQPELDDAGLSKTSSIRAKPAGPKPRDQRSSFDIVDPSFGLDLAEQARGSFGWAYSVYQVEYSRDLIFASGGDGTAFDTIVDRTRAGRAQAADPVRGRAAPTSRPPTRICRCGRQS